MKVYFEDGPLRNIIFNELKLQIEIDAKNGVSHCLRSLENLLFEHFDGIIYTNALIAIDNRYVWNEKLKVPELYFRKYPHTDFTRADSLTDKELHYAHNLMQLYLNGGFGIAQYL